MCGWRGAGFAQAERRPPSSKSGSACGTVKSALLSERTCRYAVGGFEWARDLNAARNIGGVHGGQVSRRTRRGGNSSPELVKMWGILCVVGKRLARIGEAADRLGADPQTLRNWESTGGLRPVRKTSGGHRYCDRAALWGAGRNEAAPTIGDARVSGPDRKADLDRRHAALEAYGAARGWRSEIIRDPGSGLNCRKSGLQRLPELIRRRQVERLVLTRKECLLRFGAEWVFALCELQGIEVVLIHRSDPPSFEAELARDVLEIITVFSARLYGRRSHRSRKQIADLKDGACCWYEVPELKGSLWYAENHEHPPGRRVRGQDWGSQEHGRSWSRSGKLPDRRTPPGHRHGTDADVDRYFGAGATPTRPAAPWSIAACPVGRNRTTCGRNGRRWRRSAWGPAWRWTSGRPKSAAWTSSGRCSER